MVSRLGDDDAVAADGAAASEDLLSGDVQYVLARQRRQDGLVAYEHRSLVSGLVVDDDVVAVDGGASCVGGVGQKHVPSVALDVKGVDQA